MEIKNNIKKIILLFAIFILTGCSSNYTLTLNEDSSISENVVITLEDTEENYSKVTNLINNNPQEKQNFKVLRQVDDLKITYKKDYTNIDSYLRNSYMYKQLFDNIDINKSKNKIKIDASTELNKNNISINKDNEYNFDDLQVNIDSKLPILYNNADIVNGSIYTWDFNKNQIGKNIDFTYKTIPEIITIKSILTISLIIISCLAISFIIYKRIGSIQRL